MASIEKIWKKICEKPYRSDITMQELEKVLLSCGFELARRVSSHRQYKHPKVENIITIPAHSDKSCVLPVYVKLTYEIIMNNELNKF